MKKKKGSIGIKNSCGSSGCFISIRVLPYGHRQRTRVRISKRVKAKA